MEVWSGFLYEINKNLKSFSISWREKITKVDVEFGKCWRYCKFAMDIRRKKNEEGGRGEGEKELSHGNR